LHCAPGYKPAGKRVAVCDTDLKWKPHQELKCVATHAMVTQAVAPVLYKPHIQCPKEVVKVLPKGQETVLVRIEKPVTNVDWYNYVDSNPSWGKRLEANLPLGITEVTFRARSPHTNHVDICRVVIRVIEVHPPRVVNCPESFIVNLEPNEMYRVINWNEASFESAPEDPIKQVYKSRVPGNKMGAGVHSIAYVATTENGFSAKCSFKIVVKPFGAVRRPPEELRLPPQEPKRPNRLDNHESFLVCDGKPPIKIHSNYPWHLPRGCVIKNVRVHRHRNNMAENERRRQHLMQQRYTKAPETSTPDEYDQQQRQLQQRQQQQQQPRGLANRLRYYDSFNRRQQRRQHPNNYYWQKKK
jgi:fibulin 1/2